MSYFKKTTSSYDLLNSLIYLLVSQFIWDTVSQICHINQNFGGFVYNHSFFNPNIYNICIGIYLTASTLEQQLTWWVGDKLLLMDLFSLVLLWLYMAEINSTIPKLYKSYIKTCLHLTYLIARVSNFSCFFTIPSLFLQCTYYICFILTSINLLLFNFFLINPFNNSVLHIIITAEILLMLVKQIFFHHL